MNTLVVYDSVYGNTEKIARAIGESLSGEVTVIRVGEVDVSALKSLDVLFVGSPTHGGRPSPATRELLDQIQPPALEGIKVAAFDTRLTTRWAGILGFAAGGIAKSLKKKGGAPVGSPENFHVEGTEGPLREGELERAAAWARQIAESAR
jgi:flavodoxin I